MTTMNNEDPADPSVHEPRELPEPAAWRVYFPDEQREELASSLDELCDDLTNCAHDEPEPLYTADQMREAIKYCEMVAADIYRVARAHIDIRDSVALVAASLDKTMDEAIALLGFNHWDERLKCESPTDIVFNHVRPPIPSRSYDWSAVRRSQQYDESPTTGCGSTPLLAAIDLLEQEQSC